jgi:hypothetical protein
MAELVHGYRCDLGYIDGRASRRRRCCRAVVDAARGESFECSRASRIRNHHGCGAVWRAGLTEPTPPTDGWGIRSHHHDLHVDLHDHDHHVHAAQRHDDDIVTRHHEYLDLDEPGRWNDHHDAALTRTDRA